MGASRRGFSRMDLVGLLTVSVLMLCVVVPAIRAARQQSNTDRQLSHAKEWVRGWASYSSDNGGAVVIAAPSWFWVDTAITVPNTPRMFPPNPWDTGLVGPSTNKVYTLQMLPWVSGGTSRIQLDDATSATFSSRTLVPQSTSPLGSQITRRYNDNSLVAAFAWHPSLGYNGVFVGGSYRHNAYRDSQGGPYTGTNGTIGPFYVRRMNQISNPKLVVFSPARGGDVTNTTFWGYGITYPDSGTMRPGHWLITPPVGNTALSTRNWVSVADIDGQRFNAARVPSAYGNLDFRIGSTVKTFVATADGAVPIVSLDDLRDMRRWATQATSANWNWTPGQNP